MSLKGDRAEVSGWAMGLALVLLSICWLSKSAEAVEVSAEQAMIVDFQTGAVLLDKNAQQRMPPSSMSKMMTAFMLFGRIQDGGLSLNDTFLVSEKAWRKGGSKMFVRVGEQVRVEDLIRGIVVQSGNDACIVVAEGISGSEEAFSAEMNERAKQLGMTNSNFVNASGWPDPEHYTTAEDLVVLATETIRRFPELYHYYGEKEFAHSGIKQGNRNPLLYVTGGADGLKTGHTEEAGYGLTASAIRDGRRIVMVLNGLPSKKERASESQRLMDWAFREFSNMALFKAGDMVETANVWLGASGTVPLRIDQDVMLTLPRKSVKDLKVVVSYEGPVPAPIARDSEIAKLVISAPGIETQELPLLAGEGVAGLGVFGRLSAAVNYILWGGNP